MECLLSYFSSGGICCEDIHVLDMLDGDPINHPGLKRLLMHIEEIWIKEMGPLEEVQCCVPFLNLYFNILLTDFLEPSAEVCHPGCYWLEKVYYIAALMT